MTAARCNGSVMTWGVGSDGGDSTAVQDQLRNVPQIEASNGALAAILRYGSVVTWGCAARGDNRSAVKDQLRNVQHNYPSLHWCSLLPSLPMAPW